MPEGVCQEHRGLSSSIRCTGFYRYCLLRRGIPWMFAAPHRGDSDPAFILVLPLLPLRGAGQCRVDDLFSLSLHPSLQEMSWYCIGLIPLAGLLYSACRGIGIADDAE